MTLQQFIRTYPRNQRMSIRARLGQACNVSEGAVRSWACGHRRPTPHLVPVLCAATKGVVTPREVLPEVFGYPQG